MLPIFQHANITDLSFDSAILASASWKRSINDRETRSGNKKFACTSFVMMFPVEFIELLIADDWGREFCATVAMASVHLFDGRPGRDISVSSMVLRYENFWLRDSPKIASWSVCKCFAIGIQSDFLCVCLHVRSIDYHYKLQASGAGNSRSSSWNRTRNYETLHNPDQNPDVYMRFHTMVPWSSRNLSAKTCYAAVLVAARRNLSTQL